MYFHALQAFCKDKTQLETWISQNSFSIENCAVGDDSVISQLLSKYKALLTRNADMVKLREGLYKQLDDMSIHEMCSKKASNDVRTQLNQLNTKQVRCPCMSKCFFFFNNAVFASARYVLQVCVICCLIWNDEHW